VRTTPDHMLRRLSPAAQERRRFALAIERKEAGLARAQEQQEAIAALENAEREARLARQALSRMETRAIEVRKLGGLMPQDFWTAFGKAVDSVRAAERAVCKARESVR